MPEPPPPTAGTHDSSYTLGIVLENTATQFVLGFTIAVCMSAIAVRYYRQKRNGRDMVPEWLTPAVPYITRVLVVATVALFVCLLYTSMINGCRREITEECKYKYDMKETACKAKKDLQKRVTFIFTTFSWWDFITEVAFDGNDYCKEFTKIHERDCTGDQRERYLYNKLVYFFQTCIADVLNTILEVIKGVFTKAPLPVSLVVLVGCLIGIYHAKHSFTSLLKMFAWISAITQSFFSFFGPGEGVSQASIENMTTIQFVKESKRLLARIPESE